MRISKGEKSLWENFNFNFPSSLLWVVAEVGSASCDWNTHPLSNRHISPRFSYNSHLMLLVCMLSLKLTFVSYARWWGGWVGKGEKVNNCEMESCYFSSSAAVSQDVKKVRRSAKSFKERSTWEREECWYAELIWAVPKETQSCLGDDVIASGDINFKLPIASPQLFVQLCC